MPVTYLSLHCVANLIASEGISLGAPLLLRLESEHGNMEITVFFRDEAADRTLRLVDAINSAIAAAAKPAPCPREQAAYDALHYTYQGSER